MDEDGKINGKFSDYVPSTEDMENGVEIVAIVKDENGDEVTEVVAELEYDDELDEDGNATGTVVVTDEDKYEIGDLEIGEDTVDPATGAVTPGEPDDSQTPGGDDEPGEPEDPSEDPTKVASVSVAPTSPTMTVGGDDETLTVTVLPETAADKSVTWSSSDPDVATVENGVVHAVAAGEATITVTTTDGGKTATCEVTVNAAAVEPPPTLEGFDATYPATADNELAPTHFEVPWYFEAGTIPTAGPDVADIATKINAAGTRVTVDRVWKNASNAFDAANEYTAIDANNKTYTITVVPYVKVSLKATVDGTATDLGYVKAASGSERKIQNITASLKTTVEYINPAAGKDYVSTDPADITLDPTTKVVTVTTGTALTGDVVLYEALKITDSSKAGTTVKTSDDTTVTGANFYVAVGAKLSIKQTKSDFTGAFSRVKAGKTVVIDDVYETDSNAESVYTYTVNTGDAVNKVITITQETGTKIQVDLGTGTPVDLGLKDISAEIGIGGLTTTTNITGTYVPLKYEANGASNSAWAAAANTVTFVASGPNYVSEAAVTLTSYAVKGVVTLVPATKVTKIADDSTLEITGFVYGSGTEEIVETSADLSTTPYLAIGTQIYLKKGTGVNATSYAVRTVAADGTKSAFVYTAFSTSGTGVYAVTKDEVEITVGTPAEAISGDKAAVIAWIAKLDTTSGSAANNTLANMTQSVTSEYDPVRKAIVFKVTEGFAFDQSVGGQVMGNDVAKQSGTDDRGVVVRLDAPTLKASGEGAYLIKKEMWNKDGTQTVSTSYSGTDWDDSAMFLFFS